MGGDPEPAPEISLMDAGPCITFCAVNQQSLLYDVLSHRYSLFVPDVVDDEIRLKKGKDFSAVSSGWSKLVDSGRVGILGSSAGDKGLEHEVQRIAGMPLAERLLESKDLGEVIAISLACVRKIRGQETVLLIDDHRGTKLAHQNGVKTISTEQVLRWAIQMGKIENRGELKTLYARMRVVDQALVPVEDTQLLQKQLWKAAPQNIQQ